MRPDEVRTVYAGDYLSVAIETWGGREREIVERPDVVAVVAEDRERRVVLVRQVRPPARALLTELPAGRIEPGEEPLDAARRELEEETGLRAGRWERGPSFWTTPGFCRERVHLFFATGLEHGEPRPDDGEELELVLVPRAAVPSRLAETQDGKTLVGLLLYLRRAG